MLDRIPAAWRHYVIALAAALSYVGVNWLQQNYTTWNLSPVVAAVIAAALPILTLAVTVLTRQYGVGSDPIVVDAQDGTIDLSAIVDDSPVGSHSAEAVTPQD